MNAMLRSMLISGAVLSGFAVTGTALVAMTHDQTAKRIAANERATLLRRLSELVPSEGYDNQLLEDTTTVQSVTLGSAQPQTVYRARQGSRPVAAFTTIVAPDGYGGPIRLLLGVRPDGTLTGVRVISHQETPGLGDAIEAERSDWIQAFAGRSLGNPTQSDWAVRKDGGEFDQFTGATITPRAVVEAVATFLEYFQQHREAFFPDREQPPRAGGDLEQSG